MWLYPLCAFRRNCHRPARYAGRLLFFGHVLYSFCTGLKGRSVTGRLPGVVAKLCPVGGFFLLSQFEQIPIYTMEAGTAVVCALDLRMMGH
jgi:hypothetical protein